MRNMGQMMGRMMNSQLTNNPLFQRAQQMAAGKNDDQIKDIARNLCEQMGVDFDYAMKQFESSLGIKR